ncbi:hypothetical protein HDU76_014117 [Blyttiomyces sp. JEL0837]|nr:hypothetical protein HDU76_014117 [Blyttiomyces sp. JEL0837]
MEAPYVAEFVRDLVVDEIRSHDMIVRLEKGLAYVEEALLVTVVIDISGYSKITSKLTKLGKVSSEIITRTAGRYLNQIIDVVCFYGGDIVKFLGDAILVTFEAKGHQQAEEAVALRAAICCLTILSECSEYEISLDQVRSIGRKLSLRSEQQEPVLADEIDDLKLYLHVAMTVGRTQRVIMGLPSERLDYSISGSHLPILGTIMDGTKAGELGIDIRLWSLVFSHSPCPNFIKSSVIFESSFVKCSAIACDLLQDFLATRAINSDISRQTTIERQQMATQQQARLGKFINQSIFRKLVTNREAKPSRRRTITEESKTAPGKSRLSLQYSSSGFDRGGANDSDNVPTRQRSVVNSSGRDHGDNATSSIYDDGINGEFRTVTVVFVKLGIDFDERKSQFAVAVFLTLLKKYEGFFQQFSIDDKGQTLLGVFGLPPLSHPSEPEQAVKAMIEFHEFSQEHLAGKVLVGVSSGEILFASLGTQRRREASLLGDVVNIAARLMSMKDIHGEIIADEATHLGSSNLYTHHNLGSHRVKGKEQALQIWKITKEKSHIEAIDDICGYDEERASIAGRFQQWKETGKSGMLLIEGASGLGKSKMATFLSNVAVKENIPVCLVQGISPSLRLQQPLTTSDRPYFGMSGIITFIFDCFKNGVSSPNQSKGRINLTRIHSHATFESMSFSVRRNSLTPSNDSGSRRFSGFLNADQTSSETPRILLQFMKYHGEDPSMAPLLQTIFPAFTIKETDTTVALDSQARSNLLRSLILRLFNSFVSKEKCVFLFDDSQWLDEKSLEIILSIAKFSAKSFVMVLSRPIADAGSELLISIAKHSRVHRIELQGLSRSAIEEIISKQFALSGKQISNIEDRLLTAIVQKGSSFPLYTNMIGTLMLDMIGKQLHIDSAGCLTLADDKLVDDVLLNSVGAGIILQFDRLPQQFQEILRVACCLGQYFNLHDIREVGGIELSAAEMKNIIKQSDRYNFLELAPSENIPPDDGTNESSDAYNCSFRHISFMNAIYESLSYSDRVATNLTAARRLELALTDQNEDVVLPAMSFHYSRTMDFEKNIFCLEKLGYKYVKRCAFTEGAQTFTKLEEFYRSLNSTDAASVTPLRHAQWLAETSFAWSQLKITQKAKSTALDSLALIPNKKWPTEEPNVKKRIGKSLLRLWKLWILTGGGTWTLQTSKPKSGSQRLKTFPSLLNHDALIDPNEIWEKCLSSLTVVAVYDQTFMPAMAALIVIELLCAVIVRAPTDAYHWQYFLTRASYMFHFPLKPLAKIFFKKLKKASKVDKGVRVHHFMLGILSMMLESNAMRAIGFYESYSKWSESRGDMFAYRSAQVMLGFMALRTATSLDPYEKIFSDMTYDTNDYDRTWTPTATALLVLKYLLALKFAEASPLWDRLKSMKEALSYNPASVATFQYLDSFGTLLLEGNFEKTIQVWLKAVPIASKIDRLFPQNIDLFWMTSVFIWLVVADWDILNIKQPQDQKPQRVDDFKDELIEVLEGSKKLMKYLGVDKELIPCWWVMHLFDAGIHYVKGDLKSAATTLILPLQSRRRHEINELGLISAMYYAVISKSASEREERNIFRRKASKLFERLGAGLLLRWIEE